MRVKTIKSTSVESLHNVNGKFRKFTEHLASRQRSEILRRSEVLEELSDSERHAAMTIIRQRNKNGGLDYLWTARFLIVLSKLKAEEKESEAR
ncbi:MAG: hypothetical protein ACYSWZ_07680 [Planctomycetota bacterium]|jgi:predicted mannosyl-3-phosphoglycerate phosphatase (HAD superfamily)